MIGEPMRSRRPQLVVLALAFVAMLASGPGQSIVISVFVDDMLDGTGLSRTAFSAVYAAGTVVSSLAMLLLGRVADRVGVRVMWGLASLGLFGACMLASFANGLVLAFFGLAFLRSFGQGSFPLLSMLLVAKSFRGRRGQAVAAASLGLTAASVLLPPLVAALIVEIGWREAYRVIGLALLVVVLPLAVLVRVPVRPKAADAPIERGRHPRALRPTRRFPGVHLPTRRMARLLFIVSAPPLVSTAVVFHAVSLLRDRALTLQQAALVLSVFGAANAVGIVIAGAVSDRTRTRTLLTAASTMMLLGLLGLLAPTKLAAVAAFVLLGLGGGMFGVTGGVVWPRTYGLAQIGRLQGTAYSTQIAAAALGPLPLAISDALTGGYRFALAALAVYAAAVLVVAARWRDPRIVRRRARAGPDQSSTITGMIIGRLRSRR
jgi:MFS family permease